MGYEYELLQRLADYLELELEIVIAKNINQLFEMLNRGDADLVAYGMTITTERKDLRAVSPQSREFPAEPEL
jgi:membrane-bound lytic murein transglycosylase F